MKRESSETVPVPGKSMCKGPVVGERDGPVWLENAKEAGKECTKTRTFISINVWNKYEYMTPI